MRNTGALDKALADRERQMRNYRAAKRRQYADLYADMQYGDRLKKFVKALNRFGFEDGAKLLRYVVEECGEWIWTAPPEFKNAVVESVGARVMKIREKAGLPALDDPLPGAPDDVFRRCRKQIESAGTQ